MPQSYKTIQRSFFQVSGCRVLILLLSVLLLTAAQNPQKAKTPKAAKPDNRRAEVFPHYEYRFGVPKNQADAVWNYLLQRYTQPEKEQKNNAHLLEEEQLTDLYFDNPAKDLLRQNLALRQRLFISEEGRKQHLQLLIPPLPDSATGKEARFRHNKRPDKGEAFTAHPLLKLLRKKDRPFLDSLLKPYQINLPELKPVLEINQDRKRFHLRNKGNEWLLLSFTQLHVQAPEHRRYEVQIQPDHKAFKQATPQVRRQMMHASNDVANQLQQNFPELKRTQKPEYAVMEDLRKTPAVQKISTKTVFGLSFLVLLLAIALYRYFRKKPKQQFE